MKYVALYRKYRPKCLDDVYGQKYIVDIIKNSVMNNRFFHAYLFSGPRGTGKTTVAKLIAKIVNCVYLNGYDACGVCDSCRLFASKSNPDIIEIDAASNNGVDEIRNIRDKVVLMPSVSKYKVYIIDEVHMLSISAFNALLKTLEEPPQHVIFILATTELDRVPETIVSRCQCYDFRRIAISDIVLCLKNICDSEGFSVDDDVLELIADHCNGGMRDSIGLLDKLATYSNFIDRKLFFDVVGLVSDDVICDIYDNIVNRNVCVVFEVIEKLVNSGKSVSVLVEQFLVFLRNKSVDNFVNSSDVIFKLVEGFSDISYNLRFSTNALLCFEIGVLKIIGELNNDKIISREIIFDDTDLNVVDNSAESVVLDDENVVADDNIVVNFDVVINNAFALADKNLKNDIVNKWSDFSDYVHNDEFSSVVSYFLDSTVCVAGEKDVVIAVGFESVLENACRNLSKLELLFNLVMGKFYNLAFVLDSEWNVLREKYISDVKLGKKYNYIEQNIEKDDIISSDTSDLSDVVSVANDVFGNDIVEIK